MSLNSTSRSLSPEARAGIADERRQDRIGELSYDSKRYIEQPGEQKTVLDALFKRPSPLNAGDDIVASSDGHGRSGQGKQPQSSNLLSIQPEGKARSESVTGGRASYLHKSFELETSPAGLAQGLSPSGPARVGATERDDVLEDLYAFDTIQQGRDHVCFKPKNQAWH